MSLGVLLAWVKANEAFLVSLALIISEYLGANPNIKANGFLSFLLIQLKKVLSDKKETSV